MAAPLRHDEGPRLLPMTSDSLIQRLALPVGNAPPIEKLELYRFFMSPYAPERDRDRSCSGGSRFKETEKLKFWRNAIYCIGRYHGDFVIRTGDIENFFPSVLGPQEYPWRVNKPNLIAEGLIAANSLVTFHEVREALQVTGEAPSTASLSAGISTLWNKLTRSAVDNTKKLGTTGDDTLVILGVLKDLWNDFTVYLQEILPAECNLLSGIDSREIGTHEYVIDEVQCWKYLNLALGAPVGDEHRLAFLWYVTKVVRSARRFAVDVGLQAPIKALKISLDESAEVTSKDELAVIYRHAVLVMQTKIDTLSQKATDCKSKALERSRAGETSKALKILSFAKLYEKQCNELYNFMFQLDNARGSHDRAEVFATLHTALKATTLNTKDAVDSEAMMKAIHEVRDVHEAVSEVNDMIAELSGINAQISEEELRDELDQLAATSASPGAQAATTRIDSSLLSAPSPPSHALEPARAAPLVEKSTPVPIPVRVTSGSEVVPIACSVRGAAATEVVPGSPESRRSPSTAKRSSSEAEMCMRIQRLRQ